MTLRHQPIVAFGPSRPGIGSWEWLGEDLAEELRKSSEIKTFTDRVPECDLVILVKELLPPEEIKPAASQAVVVYCPVDRYGSSAEIDRDGVLLRCCDHIVVHCGRLRKYFQSYAPVTLFDHHLRFVPESIPRREPTSDRTILWVGHRSHLPVLVDYVNRHPLPGPLEVLTNGQGGGSGEEWGFDRRVRVRIREWTDDRHLQAARDADLALDIKGDDFRQRHKPAAKAMDFLASDLPLAMNPGSSPVEHLVEMGFSVADPRDHARWLSDEYCEATRRFGEWLRNTFSRPQIGQKWQQLIDQLVSKNSSKGGGLR